VEAHANLERAITLLGRTLDPDHPYLRRARQNLKVCRDAQRRVGHNTAD
jgi:hypothetical protein